MPPCGHIFSLKCESFLAQQSFRQSNQKLVVGRVTYFFRDFLGSFAHAVEDNVRNIMVDIIKLLEEMGQAFFIVVIDHSVDVVNLSDVSVMAFKVFCEAVRVLLLNMVSPAFPVINVALDNL